MVRIWKVFSESVMFFIPGSWTFGAYRPDPGSFFLRGSWGPEKFFIPVLRVFYSGSEGSGARDPG